MIRFEHVWKEYPRQGAALRDVSFRIRAGEFVFLTGHSGSGKSTTLRLIHMAEPPTRGRIEVAGLGSPTARDAWKVRRRVGMVFQDFRLLAGRTAAENVAFALEVTDAPRAGIRARTRDLLAEVGLADKADQPVDRLSGGERQRVAIARALVNDPVVLLADEPTGNLDERATLGILELFARINLQGTAVLMATHDLELYRRCDGARLLELDRGSLTYDSAAAVEAP